MWANTQSQRQHTVASSPLNWKKNWIKKKVFCHIYLNVVKEYIEVNISLWRRPSQHHHLPKMKQKWKSASKQPLDSLALVPHVAMNTFFNLRLTRNQGLGTIHYAPQRERGKCSSGVWAVTIAPSSTFLQGSILFAHHHLLLLSELDCFSRKALLPGLV